MSATLERICVEMWQSVGWLLWETTLGDPDDVALLFEYVYGEGQKRTKRGEFYLPEPKAIRDREQWADRFVPSDFNACTWSNDERWKSHTTAYQLWSLMSYGDFGVGHLRGPLLMEHLDDIIAFLMLFVSQWLEQVEIYPSRMEYEDLHTPSAAYEMIVEYLRGA